MIGFRDTWINHKISVVCFWYANYGYYSAVPSVILVTVVVVSCPFWPPLPAQKENKHGGRDNEEDLEKFSCVNAIKVRARLEAANYRQFSKLVP